MVTGPVDEPGLLYPPLAPLRLKEVQTVAAAVRTAWNAAPQPVDRLRLPLPELLAIARDAAHQE